MVNANNPSHVKLIIVGVFVTLFGVFIKQVIDHSFVVDVLGWGVTFVGAAISIVGVMRILQD